MAVPELHLSYKQLINGIGTVEQQEHILQPLPKYLNR